MPETQVMSKSDRMELRRIVKARFELLHEQLETRAGEIRQMIRDKITQEHSKAIETAEKESAQLIKEADKLFDRIGKLHIKMEKQGIAANGGWSLSSTRERTRQLLEDWDTADIRTKIDEGIAKLKSEKGFAGLDLRSQELGLLEHLSIDALQSDEARSFLEEVPTVDKLLPLPEAAKVKALAA